MANNNQPNNDNQDVSFSSNDSTLTDTEIGDDLSIFGPGGTDINLDDSNSSFDLDDFYADEDDSEEDDEGGEPSPDQARSDHEANNSKQTSVELYDITKLLQFEFAKNPLSTQQILTKEVGGIYKHYAEHGSYLRLSENIMDFLHRGQTAVRPTTRKHIVKYTSKNMRTGEEKVVEKEELVNDLDRIDMICAPISIQGNKIEAQSRDLQQNPYDVRTTGSSTMSMEVGIHNRFGNEQNCSGRVSQKLVHIKSIKDLLPADVALSHDHAYTMTTDPDSHKLLDPNHPHTIPFSVFETGVLMRKGTSFAPGSLEALNNIFLLNNLHAQHILNWLQIKYTPTATISHSNPPAPPFALFRLAIQQLTQTNLQTCLMPSRRDPLGLTPRVRALLKDLHTNHQRGRGGMNSSQSYYSIDEDLRNDSWLIGKEHITTPNTTVVSTTESTTAAAAAATVTTRRTQDANPNGLNHVEKRILERATGIVIPNAFEDWWDDTSEQKRAWGWLRMWIREAEVKRVLEAKRDGKY